MGSTNGTVIEHPSSEDFFQKPFANKLPDRIDHLFRLVIVGSAGC
jgi:hypothetical protein